MNKRLVLAAYLTLWAGVAAGISYWAVHAGYPLWTGVVSAFLLFVFLNGSLAYVAHARRLRLEGKTPPPYVQYLFFPEGVPKLKEQAPRSTHIVVGVVTTLAGALLLLCGVALALDAQWARIPNPVLAAAICLVPASTGTALLYLAWRMFFFAKRSTNDVA